MTIKITDPISVAQTVAEFYSRNGVHGEALAEIYNAASEIAHEVVEIPEIRPDDVLAKVEQWRGGNGSLLSKYLRFKERGAMREAVEKHISAVWKYTTAKLEKREEPVVKIEFIYETRDLDGDGLGGDYISEKRVPKLGEWETEMFDLIKWGTGEYNFTLSSGQKPEEGLVTEDGEKIIPGDSVELKAVGSSQPLSGIVEEFSPENITFATDPSGRVIGPGVMATIVLRDGSEVIRALDDLRLVE